MKKSLFGILLLIPALWGIMTWVASNKTEEVYDSMLTHSQQKINATAPILIMEKQFFRKGFISSTAKSIIRINPKLFGDDESFKITLDHIIYHGPFMLTSDGIKLGTSYIKTTLDQEPLEDKTKAAIAVIFANKQPFTSSTLTNFNNSITQSIEVPTLHIDSNALELKQKDNAHFVLNLTGISAELTTNPEISYLDGFITTGEFNLSGKNTGDSFSIAASKSKTQFDIDELYHGAILAGSTTFKLAEIQVNNGQQSATLRDSSMTISGNEQDGLYSQIASIDIEHLLINTNATKTLLPESKFHMNFDLKGLEKSATRHLIDISQSLSETQASLLSNHSEQAQQQLEIDISNYLQALSDLVNPGLTNNIDIELSNDKGKSNIHFDLSYIASQKLLELKTVKDLIVAISAKLHVNIDNDMVVGTALEQLLNSSIPNNPFIKNANAYSANMLLDNGHLMLNGQSIPLLDMLGSSVNQPLDWKQYLDLN